MDRTSAWKMQEKGSPAKARKGINLTGARSPKRKSSLRRTGMRPARKQGSLSVTGRGRKSPRPRRSPVVIPSLRELQELQPRQLSSKRNKNGKARRIETKRHGNLQRSSCPPKRGSKRGKRKRRPVQGQPRVKRNGHQPERKPGGFKRRPDQFKAPAPPRRS